MESTKESDLVSAVLMYAIRCLAEGDHAALHNMKFGPREIEVLRDMNLSDLYRIESLRAHCLDIALNRQVYWPMIDHLRVQRESEETLQSLIAADAPHEMLLILFGLNARDYSRLRRTLSVHPSVGRPPEADEESSHRLWQAWSSRVDGETTGLLAPADYLELHRETEVSMRAIWSLTQRWAQYGNLTGQTDDNAAQVGGNE
jgi:tRNA(His) 5'-end guanylyltransferase